MTRNPPRKPPRRKATRTASAKPFEQPEPVSVRWTRQVLSPSRGVRIGVATLFALATTIAISPLIDSIYLRFLFTEETRVLPAVVAAGAGLGMYALGWWLYVGTVGERPAERPAVLWYFCLGIFAIILIAALFLFGLAIGTNPTT